MDNTIDFFEGEYEFLKNSYPCLIIYEGEVYPSVSHAYQSAKTDDLNIRSQIQSAASSKGAENIGRSLSLIPDWDNKRLDIMASLIKSKFMDNFDLKIKLLLTGSKELIQGHSRREQFWGKTKNGIGENHLGKILMTVRSNIVNAEGSAFNVFYTFLKDHNLSCMVDKINELINMLNICEQKMSDPLDIENIKKLLSSIK
jgi:ribA/ribD-fused uncharacterized protein